MLKYFATCHKATEITVSQRSRSWWSYLVITVSYTNYYNSISSLFIHLKWRRVDRVHCVLISTRKINATRASHTSFLSPDITTRVKVTSCSFEATAHHLPLVLVLQDFRLNQVHLSVAFVHFCQDPKFDIKRGHSDTSYQRCVLLAAPLSETGTNRMTTQWSLAFFARTKGVLDIAEQLLL